MRFTAIAAIALGSPLASLCEENPKPLKVYVLAGQSKMTRIVAKSIIERPKMFPDTAKEFAALFDKHPCSFEVRDRKIQP